MPPARTVAPRRCLGEKRRVAADPATFKIIRDPVHDIIRIQDRLLLELVDTPPLQRLRRVRQLGLACLVFPGAEHSRFTHVLGVYHLAGRVMGQLSDVARREGRSEPFTQ